MLSRAALTTGLILTVSMGAFEQLAVATVLPAAVDDIGGLELYGWAFSGFMLAQIVGLALAGGEADRRGLAGPYAVGMLLFALGLVGAGVAGSMPTLIAARLLQGLGAGAVQVLAYAAVARGYPSEARPRVLALLSTAWVVPGLVGPAIAGALAEAVGWRWVFLGIVPACGLAAVLTLPALRPLSAGDAPADGGSSRALPALWLALTIGLALAALTLSQPLLAVAGCVAALAAALPSLRHLLPAGTLRAAPGMPAATAVVALVSGAFFSCEVFLPLALTDLRGQSIGIAGLVLTASTVTWTAAAWLQERTASRVSRRVTATLGLALLLLGIAATLTVLSPNVPPLVALPTWGIAGFGIGLTYSTGALVVLETAAPGTEGEASTGLQLAFVLGTAFGTGAGGAAVKQLTTDGGLSALAIVVVYVFAMAVALAALFVAVRLPALHPSPVAVSGHGGG